MKNITVTVSDDSYRIARTFTAGLEAQTAPKAPSAAQKLKRQFNL